MIVFYTAIFGNYDHLIEQPVASDWISQGVKLICFTDNVKIKSTTYEVHYVKRKFTDGTLENRFYKINPHKVLPVNFDYAFYIDGNVIVTETNLEEFLNTYIKQGTDIAVPRHLERDCLYQEAEFCVQKNRDDHAIILKQMERFRSSGFPDHFGLSENRILITKNTEKARVLYDFWWNQIFWGSKRDQLSFCFTAWSLPQVAIQFLSWDKELVGFSGKVKHIKPKKSKVQKFKKKVIAKLKVLGLIQTR